MPDKLAVRACVFDAYGTLFDLASAAARCNDVLGDKTTAVAQLWREKQITYTWLRAAQNLHADFWQVTGDGLDFTLETLGITDPAIRARLMGLYRELTCFPEVPDVLRRLKHDARTAHIPVVMLTSGGYTHESFRLIAASVGELLGRLSLDKRTQA